MAAEPNALSTTVQAPSALGFLSNAAATFEGVQRLAEMMAKCGTLPAHLQGKPADCFRVVVQAAKWGMDPFAVAECTSLVHGRMCYEGKLVAAVLQAMGAIDGRLTYDVTGKGQDAAIVVSGTPRGAKKACTIAGTVREWRTVTKNKEGQRIDNAWDKMPETMLVYRGTRQWARVYAPEAVLGVYTPDEAEEIREVHAEVVHTDPPAARTAAPAAKENGAVDQPTSEQPSGGPNGASASAGGQSPAAGQAPRSVSPELLRARALWSELEKVEKGLGQKAMDRLCALHGAKMPKEIQPDRLASFGKDVDELAKDAIPARVADLLATWEHAAKEASAEGGTK